MNTNRCPGFVYAVAVCIVLVGSVCWGQASANTPLPYDKCVLSELFAEQTYTMLVDSGLRRKKAKLPYWPVLEALSQSLESLRAVDSLATFEKSNADPNPKDDPMGSLLVGYLRFAKGQKDHIPQLAHIEDVDWAWSLLNLMKTDAQKAVAREYLFQLYARSSVNLVASGPRDPVEVPPDGSAIHPLKSYMSRLVQVMEGRDAVDPVSTLMFCRDILTARHDLSRLFWDGETMRIARDKYASALPWLNDANAAAYAAGSMERYASNPDTHAYVKWLRQELLVSILDEAVLRVIPGQPYADKRAADTSLHLALTCKHVFDGSPLGEQQTVDGAPYQAIEVGDLPWDPQQQTPQQVFAVALRQRILKERKIFASCYPKTSYGVQLHVRTGGLLDSQRLLFVCNVLRYAPLSSEGEREIAAYVLPRLAETMVLRVSVSAAAKLQSPGVYPQQIYVVLNDDPNKTTTRYVLLPTGVKPDDLDVRGGCVGKVDILPLGDQVLCRLVLTQPAGETSLKIVVMQKSTKQSLAEIPVEYVRP